MTTNQVDIINLKDFMNQMFDKCTKTCICYLVMIDGNFSEVYLLQKA